MHLQMITIYCVCDDFLKAKGHKDHEQTQMTSAEVMTTLLVACWFFGGNLPCACAFLEEGKFISTMLSESRLNRRLHRFVPEDWGAVLTRLTELRAKETTFVIDRCPVPVCRFTRRFRSRLYPYETENPAYVGHCHAKEKDYYGLKAHTVTTASGRPVEVLLLCARSHDLTGMKELTLDLPEGATLYGDKAYNDYKYEDRLAEKREIALQPIRKKNSKRGYEVEVAKTVSKSRKRIETTFSGISALLPRKIHAVTQRGLEIKVMATFVAYAILGVAS